MRRRGRARPSIACCTRHCSTRLIRNIRVIWWILNSTRSRSKCVRSAGVGVTQVSDLIAVTDGGNGLEQALQRNLADNLTTILDWYHAAEHICDFAKAWYARDEDARNAWADEAKENSLRARGEALLAHLQAR